MADIHKDCTWKTADEGYPENPLQSLTMVICGSSKDFSQSAFDAYLYGVCVGWDDNAYAELKKKHSWSDETAERQKALHQNFIKAWNLLTEAGIK